MKSYGSDLILHDDLFRREDILVDESITVGGWIRSIRELHSVVFLVISDGSSVKTLQLVIDPEMFMEVLKGIVGVGGSITVQGKIERPDTKSQEPEVRVTKVLYVGKSDGESYPIQKKFHSMEFLRVWSHFKPRTRLFGALTRCRNHLFCLLHEFFQTNLFKFIPTPLLTSNDCEGGGDMFEVTHPDVKDYFGKSPVFLTVSGQLHIEPYALGCSRVYSFGPTFRGEKSRTSRHLAEFWMLEPEAAYMDLDEMLCLVSDMWVSVTKNFLKIAYEDVQEILSVLGKQQIIHDIQALCKLPEIITYDVAFNLLCEAKKSGHVFTYPLEWDKGLQTEHEMFLTEEVFYGPLIVRNYPRDCKAFYMKLDNNEKTVASFDFLIPGVGEIMGGSQREECYDKLLEAMDRLNLNPRGYEWYLDLRKYGTVVHSGFGLGFERYLKSLTGIDSIKDIMPYPRSYKEILF